MTTAIDDVSFDIYAGDAVSISGPSGSGKSTLLSILGLLDTPTSGRLELDGEDISLADDKRRTSIRRSHLGFIFQAFHLVQQLTAKENVAHALDIRRGPGPDNQAIATEFLARVGLEHRLDAMPATLSGGEQQRVAIARALVGAPRLLLCDEPTGNLDSKSSELVLDLLLQNHRPDSALVIVTHDRDVARYCSRHFLVSDGKLHEVGHV